MLSPLWSRERRPSAMRLGHSIMDAKCGRSSQFRCPRGRYRSLPVFLANQHRGAFAVPACVQRWDVGNSPSYFEVRRHRWLVPLQDCWTRQDRPKFLMTLRTHGFIKEGNMRKNLPLNSSKVALSHKLRNSGSSPADNNIFQWQRYTGIDGKTHT